ncbi:MAG: hypothetical protein Q8Q62_21400 [Mesorhizobium sp.]|nr:hypothetical protein [Mesorhizobium sp.]
MQALLMSVAIGVALGFAFSMSSADAAQAGGAIPASVATAVDANAPATCSPPEALGIAASFGIVKGAIETSTPEKIVVHGRMNGQKVELILRGAAQKCAVQRMSYI